MLRDISDNFQFLFRLYGILFFTLKGLLQLLYCIVNAYAVMEKCCLLLLAYLLNKLHKTIQRSQANDGDNSSIL